MTRILIATAVCAAVVGGVLGWFVLSSGAAKPPAVPPPDAPGNFARRFALTAADVPLEHETPAVAADAEGRIVVAWAGRTAELEHTLFLARSDDGGKTFTDPAAFRKVPIYRYASTRNGQEVTYSTNAAPRLAAAGGAIYLGWTEAIGGGPRVAFYVARSTDGGRSFSEPAAAQDAEGQRPGFTGLSAGPDGTVACTWLDHRKTAQLPFFTLSDPDGGNLAPPRSSIPAHPSAASARAATPPWCGRRTVLHSSPSATTSTTTAISTWPAPPARPPTSGRPSPSAPTTGVSRAARTTGLPWPSPAAGCTSSGWTATPAGAASTTLLQRSLNSDSCRAS